MGSASSGSLALGMNLSVICREMAPFTSRQAIAQANSDMPPMLATHFVAKGVLDLCDLWNVAPADPIEHLAISAIDPRWSFPADTIQ